MFETAVVGNSGRTARPFTVSFSLFAQVLVAAGAVTYPLFRIEPLPKVALRSAPRSFVELVEPRRVPVERSAAPVALNNAPRFQTERTFVQPPKAGQLTYESQNVSFDAMPALLPQLESGVPVPGGQYTGGEPIIAVAPPPRPPVSKPVPAEKPTGPVRAGGVVEPPKLLREVKPNYPPLAIQTRTQGAVRIEAILARDGTVRDARAVSGHPLLIAAALDAVRHWRYQPTLLNGQAVEVALSIDVNFTLSSR